MNKFSNTNLSICIRKLSYHEIFMFLYFVSWTIGWTSIGEGMKPTGNTQNIVWKEYLNQKRKRIKYKKFKQKSEIVQLYNFEGKQDILLPTFSLPT
jgi:hypothetical protein